MKKKKKVKVRYKNVLTFFLILILIGLAVFYVLNLKITNIYITGNDYLTDNDVIRSAGLENYPNLINNNKYVIEKKLKKNNLINKVKINYKYTSVYIKVYENYPLFFDSSTNKTVLFDKSKTTDKYLVPYLSNYVPDNIYDNYVKCLQNLDIDILRRISEIKYDPNDLDEERFYLTMSDGNYVYINIKSFSKLDKYDEILEKLNNKKGILYLDSGEYFQILSN